MRRLSLLLLATLSLVSTSGCTTPQARRAHRAGEVAAAGGLVGMLAAGVTASAIPAHDTQILTVGLAFIPISIIGALVFIATDDKANEHAAPYLTRRERHRAEAWELTKQAAAAARSADCTQVQAIDPRVRDLDLEFHGIVFLRDVAIRRCLRPQ
ncbi:MAG TPA: hypothetical protein VMZ53_20525 [Kofleriaceae bacterium]|nr:hypothetical protein [Kofleriaceae bacterium]